MKTKEELNALKNEVKALSNKLAELTGEELKQVTGGTYSPTVPDIDDTPDIEDLYPENPQPRPFN